MLTLSNYSITRSGNVLLSNTNLNIVAGEQILLVGKSGSGKTSLLESLTGHLYATGDIVTRWQESDLAKKITYVSQFTTFKDKAGLSEFYYQQRFNSYDSDNTVTVSEYLEQLEIYNSKNLLTLLGLFNFNKKLSSSLLHLSSGERKKLQLIRYLTEPSQIMLMDNPYIGLDKLTVIKLNQYLASLAQNGTMFIIVANPANIPEFVTHLIEIKDDKTLAKIKKDDYSYNDTTENHKADTSLLNLLSDDVSYFDTIVRFANVKISYDNKSVLNGIDWLIKSGEKWLLSGENGAGKSTILSLINGDHPQAYANDIVLFDKKRGSGETIWELKKKIGYISPELHWNFDRNITCLQTILSGFFDTPGLYKKADDNQIKIANEWIMHLELSDYQDKLFSHVSNGIQRIFLLLRAIVKNPPLFIFDEPCQGLDEVQAKQFINLVDQLFSDSKHTIIYVSHISHEIPCCIDHKLHIANGLVEDVC